jgi:hypothetical protein
MEVPTPRDPQGVDRRALTRLAADIGRPANDIIDAATIASLCRQYAEWLRGLPSGRLPVAGRLMREAMENERLARLAGSTPATAAPASSSHLDDGCGHGLPLPSPGLNGDAFSIRNYKHAEGRRACNRAGDVPADPHRLPLVKLGTGGTYVLEWKPEPNARRSGWLGRILDIFG